MMAALLSCQKQSVPYLIERYNKNVESKIDKVYRIIDRLLTATGSAYGLLMDYVILGLHLKK